MLKNLSKNSQKMSKMIKILSNLLIFCYFFKLSSLNKDCEEIGKPEINNAYNKEIADMEEKNGVHSEFLHPNPA